MFCDVDRQPREVEKDMHSLTCHQIPGIVINGMRSAVHWPKPKFVHVFLFQVLQDVAGIHVKKVETAAVSTWW